MGEPADDVDALGRTAAVVTARSAGPGLPLDPTVLGPPRASMAPPPSSDELPLIAFGPYSRVEALAEQGAMGLVARGHNAAFDRWELLKFLRLEHAASAELVRQFHREGRILARLSHPHVVQVFAIYQQAGRACLAMEFLEGESLRAHVEKENGRIPLAHWQELFAAAARGLSAAHEVGLLHRDLKPENLFVLAAKKGNAPGLKLIDFGLATADRKSAGALGDPSLVAQMSGGTPPYMAPELWRGEDASPRTDVYALGMTFFWALSARLPFEATTVSQTCLAVTGDTPFVDPASVRPELPASLADVVRRAIAKKPEDRFATADELLAALVAAQSAARARKVPGSGPYRGLGAFTAAERDVFFGRDAEVAEVVERLRVQPGVVLVGPSGAGKSSLALAGVVPAIEEGALAGGVVYTSTRLEPRAHAAASLAAALSQVTRIPEKELLVFLRTRPASLGPSLREALPDGAGIVIVVDQLEELSTLAADAGEARDFATALASLVEVASPKVRLVATLRADLMDRLFTLEALRPLLTRGFHPVRPLLGDSLRRALEEPARAAGYAIEDPRVVDAIVEDVARTPAGLPLASFAMASWWEARDETRRVLPTAAWTSLGGLGGALARHGEAVLDAMSAAERVAAEQILVRLVTADGTRARATREALLDPAAAGPGAARALDRLLGAKLLHDASGELSLVHEALVTDWPRLRASIASSGDDRAFRERVTAAAREWDAQGRPSGALWSDEQATRLARWFSSTTAPLGQTELSFVEAVRWRVARRRLVVRSVIAAVVLVALTFGMLAKTSERDMAARLQAATTRATEAEVAFKRSEAGRLAAQAAAHVEEDPAAAVAAAVSSYELLHEASLDPLVWRARSLGLPRPLPMHGGGVVGARFLGKGAFVASAGLDGSVHVLSTTGIEHVSFRASREAAGMPRSLATTADTDVLAIGTTAGELVIATAPAFAAQIVGHCKGRLESLVFAKQDLLVGRCVHDGGRGELFRFDVAARSAKPLLTHPVAAFSLTPGATVGAVVTAHDARLFDLDAGTVGDVIELPKGDKARAVAVSADGTLVAIGDEKGAVHVAVIKNGKADKPRELAERHLRAVASVAFDPSSSHLLSLGHDGMARIWPRSLGRPISVETAGNLGVFLPTRRAVALAGRHDDVLIVSLDTGERVGKLVGSASELTTMGSDAAGRWMLTGSREGGVRAYDLGEATSRVTAAPHPETCALSPDGTTMVCQDADALALLTVEGSAAAAAPTRQIPLPKLTRLSGSASSAKGEHVAWWTNDTFAIDGQTTSLGFFPLQSATSVGAPLFALSGDREGRSSLLLQQPKGGAAQTISLPRTAYALAISRDGTKVYAALDAGEIVPVESASGRILPSLHLAHAVAGDEPRALSVSDDGSLVGIATKGGRVFVIGTDGAHERALAKLPTAARCLSFAESGRALFAGTERDLRVVDLETGASIAVAASGPIAACARSPFDDRITFVTETGAAYVRSLDLSSVSLAHAPESALDPHAASLEQWRGLEIPAGKSR